VASVDSLRLVEPELPDPAERRWEPEPGTIVGLLWEVLGQGVGAYVGLHDPITGAMLAPAVSAALKTVYSEISASAGRQTGHLLEGGAAHAGLDVEELVRRLTTSPESLRLLALALQGASVATDVDVLNALGRSLSNAATDGSVIEDESYIAAALRELNGGHLRLMRRLLQTSPYVSIDDAPGPIRDRAIRGSGMTREAVLRGDPSLETGWDMLLATLVRLGLVEQAPSKLVTNTAESLRLAGFGERATPTDVSPKAWRVTPLGMRVYDRVREAAT
jgi:hypothetical protein